MIMNKNIFHTNHSKNSSAHFLNVFSLNALLFIPLFLVGGFFISMNTVHGYSFFMSYFGSAQPIYYTGYYNLSDTTLNCGDSTTADARIRVGACNNLSLDTYLYIAGTQVYGNSRPHIGCVGSTCGSFIVDSGIQYKTLANRIADGTVLYGFRVRRDDIAVPFDALVTKSLAYTVGTCSTFSSYSVNSGSCARTGDATQSGNIGMYITGVPNTVASYGFKCGSQPEVKTVNPQHTCIFDSPATVALQYSIYDASGNELNRQVESGVVIDSCACGTNTSSFEINGTTGTVGVSSGDSFTVEGTFTNSQGENYICTLSAPTVSTLASGVVSHSFSMVDTISSTGSYTYQFQCVGPDTNCPIENKSVGVTVDNSTLSANIGISSDPIQAGSPVVWTATVSGGVPDPVTAYDIVWWGVESASGHYSDNTVRMLGSVTPFYYPASVGSVTIFLRATDSLGQSRTVHRTVPVVDTTLPQ
jgi:hypothetical protein